MKTLLTETRSGSYPLVKLEEGFREQTLDFTMPASFSHSLHVNSRTLLQMHMYILAGLFWRIHCQSPYSWMEPRKNSHIARAELVANGPEYQIQHWTAL